MWSKLWQFILSLFKPPSQVPAPLPEVPKPEKSPLETELGQLGANNMPRVVLPPWPDTFYGRLYVSKGANVKLIQQALKSLGYDPGPIDSEFGELTERAVMKYQAIKRLEIDGIVGQLTWDALRGISSPAEPAQQPLLKLAEIAKAEAEKNLVWTNEQCEAEKLYLAPLRKALGMRAGFFNWCAAFVLYCARKAGYQLQDKPEGFYATFALVESFRYWAKKHGCWYPKGSVIPTAGDIVVYDWKPYDGIDELWHVGIVLSYKKGILTVAEGNHSNKSEIVERDMTCVVGFIRLPEKLKTEVLA